jgi:hypothetical protein
VIPFTYGMCFPMKRFVLALVCLFLFFAADVRAEPFRFYQLDPRNPDAFRVMGLDRNQSSAIELDPLNANQKSDLIHEFNWNETGHVRAYPLGPGDYRIFNRDKEQTDTISDDHLKKDAGDIEKSE